LNPATGSELPTVTSLITPLVDVDDRGVYFADEPLARRENIQESFTSWRDHIQQGAASCGLCTRGWTRRDAARRRVAAEHAVLLVASDRRRADRTRTGGAQPDPRGAALERDIRHADCQVVLADSASAAVVGDIDHIDVDSPEWAASRSRRIVMRR
jgi:fatty-acyl-CoA synthase